jgi:hypothetical protein
MNRSSTLVFTVILCVSFLSCQKRSNFAPQENGISATINGVTSTFNFHDTLLINDPNPDIVIGYGATDTISTIPARIIITLGTSSNPYSGTISYRPANSTNVYTTAAGTFAQVNTVSLINKLAVGTCQGSIYLNGDLAQTKLVVTNGNFDVEDY